jgi:hypothetical protein
MKPVSSRRKHRRSPHRRRHKAHGPREARRPRASTLLHSRRRRTLHIPRNKPGRSSIRLRRIPTRIGSPRCKKCLQKSSVHRHRSSNRRSWCNPNPGSIGSRTSSHRRRIVRRTRSKEPGSSRRRCRKPPAFASHSNSCRSGTSRPDRCSQPGSIRRTSRRTENRRTSRASEHRVEIQPPPCTPRRSLGRRKLHTGRDKLCCSKRRPHRVRNRTHQLWRTAAPGLPSASKRPRSRSVRMRSPRRGCMWSSKRSRRS